MRLTGTQLLNAREALGLTQAEVAVGFRCSTRTIMRRENDQSSTGYFYLYESDGPLAARIIEYITKAAAAELSPDTRRRVSRDKHRSRIVTSARKR